MFGEKNRSEGEIIEIVGKALREEEKNGKVGVYSYIKQIVLWDVVKKDDYRFKLTEKLNVRMNALMDHLGLEFVEGGAVAVRKVAKKGEGK